MRIATRGSKLALWQAEHVRALLLSREPGLSVELVVLKTRGDRILDRALSEVGGKGLFVKEIEEALLDGRADIAVHSMKDLTSEMPPELVLAAVPEREDPRDALVVHHGLAARTLAALPAGARVGTSSLRRACLLHATRPDLVIEPLRGNVDTRLGRLDEGAFDAIVLACAGLRRLGHGERISAALSVEESLPAVGQGALALQCRADDGATRARLALLEHTPTRLATNAERAFLARLEGDCKTPLAAHATLDGDALTLRGLLASPDGKERVRATLAGAAANGPELGRALADQLRAALGA